MLIVYVCYGTNFEDILTVGKTNEDLFFMLLRSRRHLLRFFFFTFRIFSVNSTVFDFIFSVIVMTLYIQCVCFFFFVSLPFSMFSMNASMSLTLTVLCIKQTENKIKKQNKFLQTRTTRTLLEWCTRTKQIDPRTIKWVNCLLLMMIGAYTHSIHTHQIEEKKKYNAIEYEDKAE